MLLIRYLLQFVEKAIDGAAVAYILILFANRNDAGAASTLAIVATCVSTVGAYLIARKADRRDKTKSLQAIEVIRGSLLLMLAVAGSSSIVLALAYCALLLFQALVAPIADALAVQDLEAKDRTTLFSRIYWVTNVAKLFGLVVGMLAIKRGFFEWLLGGFACLSYVIAVTCVYRGGTSVSGRAYSRAPIGVRRSFAPSDRLIWSLVWPSAHRGTTSFRRRRACPY